MADPFYGEIRIFGFNYPPQDWAFCNGQEILVQQNPALFSLLNKIYGGDGQTKFNLPNMQGYAPIGAAVPNSYQSLGVKSGADSVALTTANSPPHDHTVQVISPPIAAYEQAGPSAVTMPIGAIDTTSQIATKIYKTVTSNALTGPTTMSPVTISSYGNGQPHENRQPFLAMNFCIALIGIYPSFN